MNSLNQLSAYWLGEAYELSNEHRLALSIWSQYGVGQLLVAKGAKELESGASADALRTLRFAVELEPSSEAWAGFAEALFRLERIQDAETAFLRALEYPGPHSSTYARLGDIAAAAEDWRNALMYYRSSLRENPYNESARVGLIVCEYGITGDSASALRQLQQTVKEFPDYLWGYLTLARLCSDLHLWRDADHWFALAHQRFPDDFAVSSWWAFSRMARADYPGAIQLLSQACREEPDDPYTHVWLAQALYLSNQCELATDELAHAVQLSSYDPELLESVGDLYAQMGEGAEARAAYEAALNVDPTRSQVRSKLLTTADAYEGRCK